MKRTPLRATPPADRTSEPGYREWKAPVHGRCANCGTRGLLIRHHVILEQHVIGRAREMLAGITATVANPDADTLLLLERAIADSEQELDAFAGDTKLRRALGDRYHDHLNARVDAVEQARRAYREQARRAQNELTLSVSELLDESNPLLLSTGLRGIFGAVVVMPGRGLSVGRRVRLVPFDDDRAAGVEGAEGS